MKYILGCCLLFFSFLSFTNCDAQIVAEPIHVPLLKERKIIDSLMERVLKDELAIKKTDTSTTKDSFLFLEI
jgi:hypothetical protein